MLGPNIGVCIYPPAASNAPTVDETAQFDRRRQHERDMNYGPFCIKTDAHGKTRSLTVWMPNELYFNYITTEIHGSGWPILGV